MYFRFKSQLIFSWFHHDFQRFFHQFWLQSFMVFSWWSLSTEFPIQSMQVIKECRNCLFHGKEDVFPLKYARSKIVEEKCHNSVVYFIYKSRKNAQKAMIIMITMIPHFQKLVTAKWPWKSYPERIFAKVAF